MEQAQLSLWFIDTKAGLSHLLGHGFQVGLHVNYQVDDVTVPPDYKVVIDIVRKFLEVKKGGNQDSIKYGAKDFTGL